MWQFLPCHSNTILLLLLQSPSSPLLQQLSCHAWFLFYFMKFAAILWPVLKCYRILWTFTKYYEICGNFVTDDRWRRQIKAPPDDCWLNMCAAASIHNLAFGHQCGFFADRDCYGICWLNEIGNWLVSPNLLEKESSIDIMSELLVCPQSHTTPWLLFNFVHDPS